MLTTLLFSIQNFWQLSLLELSSLLRPCFLWRAHTYQQCDFALGLLQLIYLHDSIWPPLWQCRTPASPLHSNLLFFFRLLHMFSLCTLTTASCSWRFLFTSCFLFSSLTLSGFFNGVLADSKPVVLKFYTLFCLIPLTLFVFRNLTLTYLSLSGSLDSLLCDLIAFTPRLVFFLLMSHTPEAASSFSSGRAYPSLNFLLPLFLRLTLTLIM